MGERRAIVGFLVGLMANGVLWQFAPGVSWLWWNVSGFIVAFTTAVIGTTLRPQWPGRLVPAQTAGMLLGMAALIFAVCVFFEWL